MATVQKAAIEILTPDKGTFRIYRETAAMDTKKGELVTIASGKAEDLAGTDPANTSIAGIAMADASGVTDAEILVFVPDIDCLFVANLGVAQVSAETDIGARYGLVEASNKVHVDQSDTTVDRVVVVDLLDPVGDTNGRVIFKFLPPNQLTGQIASG